MFYYLFILQLLDKLKFISAVLMCDTDYYTLVSSFPITSYTQFKLNRSSPCIQIQVFVDSEVALKNFGASLMSCIENSCFLNLNRLIDIVLHLFLFCKI